jgi:hypothetical protein
MPERTEYSWDRLAVEASARMAEHDALSPDLREVSNEHGIAVARELAATTHNDFLNAVFG